MVPASILRRARPALAAVALACIAASIACGAASRAFAEPPRGLTGTGPVAAPPPSRSRPLNEIRVGLMSLEAPPEVARTQQALALESDSILARVQRDLGLSATSRFRMILIPAGTAEDSELRALDGAAPWWAAGFTIPERRICAIRLAQSGRYPYGSSEAVLAHEATHLMIHDRGGRPLPLWFEEGVATWEGRRWEFRDMVAYSSALLTTALPHLADLDSSFHASAGDAQLAYAGAHAFVASTVHAHGPAVLRELLAATRDRPFAAAWLDVTGESLRDAEDAWRRTSLLRYRWIPLLTASSTLWGLISLLYFMAGAYRRAAQRRQRANWPDDGPDDSEAWWMEGGESAGREEPAPGAAPPAGDDPPADPPR